MIDAVSIGAGHDGQADLIVTLRFDNGRTSHVTLDTDAGLRLMRNCNAKDISELVGHSWHGILEGMTCSI